MSSRRSPSMCHGDLHLLNTGWCVNGEACIFDWESAAVGCPEIDVAQILRSIAVDTPRHAVCTREDVALRVRRRADETMDLDWVLVEALVRFRCATALSHLLLGAEETKIRANLAVLDGIEPGLSRAA